MEHTVSSFTKVLKLYKVIHVRIAVLVSIFGSVGHFLYTSKGCMVCNISIFVLNRTENFLLLYLPVK